MVGLSYPGISQLFVAQLRPPHLAAIAPLSVIDDTIRGTLAPGRHPQHRLRGRRGRRIASTTRSPRPAAARRGRPTASTPATRRASRTRRCTARRPTSSQTIETQQYWTDAIGLPLSPEHFVQQDQRAGVPRRRLAGRADRRLLRQPARPVHRDEGGAGSPRRTAATPIRSIPTVFARWVQFLSIFVAQKVPQQTALTSARRVDDRAARRSARPRRCRPTRSSNVTTLRAGEAAVRDVPARAHPVRERRRRRRRARPRRASKPTSRRGRCRGTTATPWYFGADGTLVDDARRARPAPTRTCTTRRTRTTRRLPADSQSAPWAKLPAFGLEAARGRAPRSRTRPRRSRNDATVIGNASVDLWLKSTAPDTDLQVTITEVRPDGKEMYVQNGWLRASHRALAPDATELRPTHPFTEGRRGAAARRRSSSARASRCSRSRTCSAPARASA